MSMILTMLAETFIHAGIGQSIGAVDLPVMRESTTHHPVIYGSSLKGSLRERLETRERLAPNDAKNAEKTFGKQDDAGHVLVGDARLLLLPVRSQTGTYQWVTCPLILERLQRDLERAGQQANFTVPTVDKGNVLRASKDKLVLEELYISTCKLVLEELQFSLAGQIHSDLVTALQAFIPHESAKVRLGSQLAILNDGDFAWFAQYGLSVQAHNQLDDQTKQSNNLWFEENLPPDTVMYAVLGERQKDTLKHIAAMFKEDKFLRVGGDETTGKGWMRVGIIPAVTVSKTTAPEVAL